MKVRNCLKKRMVLSQRTTIFTIFLTSYIILLAVPIAISVIAYYITQTSVRDDILHTNYVERVMIAEQLDTQIAAAENQMSRIAVREKFTGILRRIETGQEVSAYEYTLLVQELKSEQLYTGIVMEAYIFFKNTDVVVSNQAVTSKAVAYDIYHRSDAFSYEQWDDIMQMRHTREIKVVPASARNFSDGDQIVYLQSLPLSYDSDSEATLVMFLDKSRILEVFGEMPDVGGDIYVVDEEGNTMVSSGDIEIEPRQLMQAVNSGNLIYRNDNKRKYVMSANQSKQIKGIYYVSLIPEDELLSQTVKIRNICIGAVALILIAGFGFIFYFSRKNVAPIHNMVKLVRKTIGSEVEENSDDVRYIATAIESIKSKIFFTEKDLRIKKRVSKNYFLRSFLLEEFSDRDAILPQAKENEVYCGAGNYIVILLYVYEYQKFFEDSDALDRTEQEKMVHFILSNVLTDLFEEKNYCQMVHIEGFVSACIVCTDEDAYTIEEKIENVLETAYNFISGNFQIYFTAAVSGCHEFENLNEAYNEAVSVAYYGKPDDETLEAHIVFYQKDIEDDLNIIDESFERKFTNYLKSQSIEEAKACLEDFFDSCGVYLPEYGSMMKYDILLIMLKVMPEKNRNMFMEQTSPFAQLAKCKSFSAVENIFYSLLDAAAEFLPVANKNTNKFCDDIKRYVMDKYSDVNLSITMIAEHFDMNPHYISMQFKEQSGESLKTFINFVRIEKAKQILLTTPKKLEEIANMVGFIDNNAFIRVFKKFEGITPGKYREITRDAAGEKA